MILPSHAQASIENHQTYELKRESWLAKKTLPEKVELDVTTVLLVNESSVRPKFLTGRSKSGSLSAKESR